VKAVSWQGPFRISADDSWPRPALRSTSDALVKVSAASICGTDLHAYRGEVTGFPVGTILGHEFVGTIAEIGSAVVSRQVGERVVASDLVACGRCAFCVAGQHYQCEHGTLFGYGTVVGDDVAGGQAEYVRVPFADTVLLPVPPCVDDEAALLASDVLATAIRATSRGVGNGTHLAAIVGGGPVGLMIAAVLRASYGIQVVVTEPNEERRAIGEALGCVAMAPSEATAPVLLHRFGYPAADVTFEAVGSPGALAAAVGLTRPGGTVVVVGARTRDEPFPAGLAFAKELELSFVVGDPIASSHETFAFLSENPLISRSFFTHRFPLSAAAEAYEIFDRGQALKVVLVAS
jgi:2-desacetyl-2-hydroxyethyl bacteriochlorophyllide A dehydrogenase